MLFIKYFPLKEFVSALQRTPTASCYTPFTCHHFTIFMLTLRSYWQFMVRVVQVQGYLMF